MKRITRRLFGVLRVGIGIGLLVYLGVSGVITWSALLGLLQTWPVSLTALLLLLVVVFLTSWRLCILLWPCDMHLSLLSSIRLTLIGIFFNTCLPGATGGDIVRIYYAAEGNHGRRTEVATIMLLDRIVGMFALMLLPLLVAPFFGPMLASLQMLRVLLWAAAAMTATMLVGILLCSSPRVRYSRIASWAFQTLPLGAYLERIFDTLRVYRHNRGALFGAVVLSLMVHMSVVSVVLLMVHVMHPSGVSWPMMVLIPLGLLANSLPVTPGGLGVGEAAFNTLFEMAGFTGGAEALLGWRMLMLLIGLIGLLYYLQGGKRFVHAASAPTVMVK